MSSRSSYGRGSSISHSRSLRARLFSGRYQKVVVLTIPAAVQPVSGATVLQTCLCMHFGSQHEVAIIFLTEGTVDAVFVQDEITSRPRSCFTNYCHIFTVLGNINDNSVFSSIHLTYVHSRNRIICFPSRFIYCS